MPNCGLCGYGTKFSPFAWSGFHPESSTSVCIILFASCDQNSRTTMAILSSLYLHLLLEPTMVVALFEEEVDARWEEECWSVGERSYLHPPVIPLCSQLPAPTCPPEPTLH